jgi:hypothetical protein
MYYINRYSHSLSTDIKIYPSLGLDLRIGPASLIIHGLLYLLLVQAAYLGYNPDLEIRITELSLAGQAYMMYLSSEV